MKCPKCKTINQNGARFCRHCGTELSGQNPVKVNVMERFPKYHFVPTNLIEWKKPWFARFLTFLFSVVLVCSLVVVFYSMAASISYNTDVKYVEYDGKYLAYTKDGLLKLYSSSGAGADEKEAQNDAHSSYQTYVLVGVLISAAIALIAFLLMKLVRRQSPPKNNPLSKVADYVQKYSYSGFLKGRKSPVLKFYVKDNKMGLLDVAHYCVFLNAQYDQLSWREKNKYLNAKDGGRSLIIDVHGKELK